MANPPHRSVRKCPNGHSMDPNWVSCPYCEAEAKVKQKSAKPSDKIPDRQRTRVGAVIPNNRGPETKIMTSSAMQQAQNSGAPASQGDTRKITGVLVTYSWLPEGELFIVREGKNYIGRDRVASDTAHQNCDIQVPRDGRMSGEHALILCRQGSMEIIDSTSANGTYLNDKLLRANESNDLPERATIKTGDTLWSFMAIQPPPGTIVNRKPAASTPEPSPPPKGDPTIVQKKSY